MFINRKMVNGVNILQTDMYNNMEESEKIKLNERSQKSIVYDSFYIKIKKRKNSICWNH